MQSAIHPPTYDVIFLDTSTGAQFISQSTKKPESEEKITVGKKEYYVIKVELSSDSHPFFTGKQKLLDTAGRVDKFRLKMEQAQKMQKEAAKKVKMVDEDEEEEVAEVVEEVTVAEEAAEAPAEEETPVEEEPAKEE